MDPISIISLAGTATKSIYQISTQIYLFINHVKEVDDTVRALSTELSGLRRSLDAISTALQNPIVRTEKATAPENTPIWAAVAGALDDCRRSLEDFEKKIAPHQQAKNRRNIFKRSVTAWKLDLSDADIRGIRGQTNTHTNSLQVALQTVNILICGLSPANAVEDISEKINNLVTTVKSTSIESKDDPSAPHLKQVNEVARAVISSAPEFVSTGSLGVGSDEVRSASASMLRDVIVNYERSLRDSENAQTLDSLADVGDSSDSDDDLEQALAQELITMGNEMFGRSNYEEAERYYRDGLRHDSGISRMDGSLDLEDTRLKLAVCCFHQEKLEEAELMLLILAKNQMSSRNRSLQAYHYLAQVYLCLYDFESALEYCSLALKGRKWLYGKHEGPYQSSLQLLSLLYHANGDLVAGNAYAKRLAEPGKIPVENIFVADRFSGYLPVEHLRMSLKEKEEAMIQLSEADILRDQRTPSYINSKDGSSQRKIMFKFGADALNFSEALLLAATQNKQLLVRWLLSRGADPNGGPGSFPLVAAAHKGNEAIVRLLLDSGAEIDATSDDQRTPLWRASIWGHESTARVLVERGADINHLDRDLQSPFMQAACKGHISIMEMLLSKGATTFMPNGAFNSALTLAFKNHQLDSAKYLIEHSINLDDADVNGEKPLLFAVSLRQEVLVKLLLDKGVNVDCKDRGGNTALIKAAESGTLRMLQLLMDAGADVNAMNRAGFTALFQSVKFDHADTLRLLIKKGADPNLSGRDQYLGSWMRHNTASKCVAAAKEIGGFKDCRARGEECNLCARYDGQ